MPFRSRHAGRDPASGSQGAGAWIRACAGMTGGYTAPSFAPADNRPDFRGWWIDKTHTLDDDLPVETPFDWSTEKNQQLVEQRGISFERIVTAIEQGGLVNVLEHPNQERYPGQMIYVVDIERYLYLVPFVTEADGTRFLKTIIPSRKATRDHHRRQSS